MADALGSGRRFRTFNVIDDFNRESMVLEIDTCSRPTVDPRLRAPELRTRCARNARRDKGRNSLARYFAMGPEPWHGDPIVQPGKPTETPISNVSIAPSARTYSTRACVLRLDDVGEAAHWWMIDYNEQRPHDSLSDMTPCEYAQQFAGGSTSEMSA